ncbi:MAG TPA: DUF1722 domain-containing protein [candidate division Zixibacteria bacterium]|nr:DUF1722 domain-containing protein [candidate division Zixibacteria bacterium]HEQ98106.1 DUF1722 domain-containing protein [candidate division Zixibacteria bacterium]
MPDVLQTEKAIKVGISACLLGQMVRYDAGHKRDRYSTDVLSNYFQFVSVCPEVEVGMGVPREAVRLVGTAEETRMVGNKTGKDWTEKVVAFNAKRANELEKENLSGFILKKDSPSCGMERVKVYNEKGMAEKNAVGMWPRALKKQFPIMPMEEEGRLNDPRLRENFIVRVFAYHRLQNLFDDRYSRGKMVRFHTAHKLLLMSHSPKHYKELGKLVAEVKKYSPSEMREKYSAVFMEGLGYKTTAKKNVNVLHHILGYLKTNLTSSEKKDILQVIDDYHKELTPLVVPLTLLRHYVTIHDIEYIKDQIYLTPHPKELMLRNHV